MREVGSGDGEGGREWAEVEISDHFGGLVPTCCPSKLAIFGKVLPEPRVAAGSER